MDDAAHEIVRSVTLGGRPAPSRSSSRLRPGLGGALLSLLVACSGGESDSSPRPSATTAPESPADPDVAVDQPLAHSGSGFELTLPRGWSATEPLDPNWPAGAPPYFYSAGFTTFASPDAATLLGIGSRPLRGGSTLTGWQRQLTADHALDFPQCERSKLTKPITLDGVPATRRWLSCETVGASGDLMLTVHENRGWAVLCSVPPTDESTTHRQCEELLRDFHFTAE